MDWNNIATLAGEQSPVFWTAVAAVSLGLTLLIVALLQGLRRTLTARRTMAAPAMSAEPPQQESAPVPAAAPAFAHEAYETATTPAPRDSGSGSVAQLLRRLQSAGDRLEEIASDLEQSAGFDHGSVLKSDVPDVEYVFRASGS